MNTSFWERESFLKNYDVLIVGAGLAGLYSAIELKLCRPNCRIAILERSWLSDGASSKNAGFACFGSLSEFLDDMRDMSFDEVVQLAVSRYNGIKKMVGDFSEEVIELEWNGGYELFFEEDKNSFDQCCKHITQFNDAFEKHLGIRPYEVLFQSEFQGIKNLEGVIFNKYEGGLNTGSLLKALRSRAVDMGIRLFHGVEVNFYKKSEEYLEVQTSAGIWCAHRIAFCTSSFHSNLFEDLKMSSKRNQVVITQPISDIRLNGTFHHQQGFNYFRNVGNRILMGGMRHCFPHSENTQEQGNTEEVIEALQQFIQQRIHTTSPIAIDLTWSGILGVGTDERPVVKEIEPHVFVGVRLGGIGVAMCSLVGQELAQAISDSFSQ